MELWILPDVGGPHSRREHLRTWIAQIGDQLNALQHHMVLLERQAGHHGRHQQYPPTYDEFNRLPAHPRQTDLENLQGWLSSIGERIGHLGGRIHHLARALQSATTPGAGPTNAFVLGDAGGGQEMFVHASKGRSPLTGRRNLEEIAVSDTHDVNIHRK